MDCLFCKIIDGSISSYIIYEDDLVKVFLDIYPNSNGHMLVVPKNHYVDMHDINENVLIHIHKVIAPKIDQLLKDKLHSTGLSISQNNGSAQDIKHYHTHLIPKYDTKQPTMEVIDIYKTLTK